jgi:hypothetical protein
MPDQNQTPQDQRRGGYGDSAGGADPAAETPNSEGSNASGRESPVTDATDADEALGNRTGGYGGNPPSGGNPPKE